MIYTVVIYLHDLLYWDGINDFGATQKIILLDLHIIIVSSSNFKNKEVVGAW